MPNSLINRTPLEETFRGNLLAQGILDAEDVHHEFAYGDHGRKLDFDRIEEGTQLYQDWVYVCAQSIRDRYPLMPDAVLGVANGTNRLSKKVAASLGILALYTEKVSPREVAITSESLEVMRTNEMHVVVVLEDVGTTGGTALTAAEHARKAGAKLTEVQFTWKRQDELASFNNSDIPYYSIIDERLKTYSPEECQATGFCANGIELIRHGK